MSDHLHAARAFATKIKFSGDELRSQPTGERPHDDFVRSQYFQDHLQLSAELTPGLFACLNEVYAKLAIPADQVAAFVYPSPAIKVDCFNGDVTACILRISSAMIKLLSEQELKFVVGQELGHWLLGSEDLSAEAYRESMGLFTRWWAREISVDRLGLIACASFDAAIKAIVKTVSGLSEPYLRFDTAAFVAQFELASVAVAPASAGDSHSSIPVRCRALLWFDAVVQAAPNFPGERMSPLDERVQADLTLYLEDFAKQRIAQAKHDFAMWRLAYEVVEDGVFDKREQASVAEEYGHDTIERIKSVIDNVPVAEAKAMIYSHIKIAQEELANLIPEHAEAALQEIEDRIRKIF